MIITVRTIALFLAVAAAGCGKSQTTEFTDLSGTVTCDGRPLAGVVVTFDPAPGPTEKGIRADAVTDENGTYRLRTANPAHDGIAVGTYKVTVRSQQPTGRGRSTTVPRDYTIPSRTPLGPMDITRDTQKFDIAMVSTPIAGKRR